MSNEIWRICSTNLIQTVPFIFLLSMLQHRTVVHTSTIRCVPCFPVCANLSQQLCGTAISITVPALYRTTLCLYMATYRSVLHLSPYGMISPHLSSHCHQTSYGMPAKNVCYTVRDLYFPTTVPICTVWVAKSNRTVCDISAISPPLRSNFSAAFAHQMLLT